MSRESLLPIKKNNQRGDEGYEEEIYDVGFNDVAKPPPERVPWTYWLCVYVINRVKSDTI